MTVSFPRKCVSKIVSEVLAFWGVHNSVRGTRVIIVASGWPAIPREFIEMITRLYDGKVGE